MGILEATIQCGQPDKMAVLHLMLFPTHERTPSLSYSEKKKMESSEFITIFIGS